MGGLPHGGKSVDRGLISGVAGSGKSMLAKRLAPALDQPRAWGRRLVPAARRSQLRSPVGAPSRRSADSARNELAPRTRSGPAQGSRPASVRDPLHLPRRRSQGSNSWSPSTRPASDTPRGDQPGDDRLIRRHEWRWGRCRRARARGRNDRQPRSGADHQLDRPSPAGDAVRSRNGPRRQQCARKDPQEGPPGRRTVGHGARGRSALT